MSDATSRTPAIIGFLIAGALILGVGYFVGNREPRADGTAVPELRVLEPRDGDSLRAPVTLRFRTPAALELHPGMGWMAGDLHLHAMVDGIEIMPAAADIAVMPDSSYAWQLRSLEPGQRHLYLTWAARHHGNVAGVTDTIRIHILP